MKNQYVGDFNDFNDFKKYSVLRELQTASGLPLVVCWMLTPPAGSYGGNIRYVQQPQLYARYEPYVFAKLQHIIKAGTRSIRAIDHQNVLTVPGLARPLLFPRLLRADISARGRYFRAFWPLLNGPSLLFFDPDVGLEVGGTAYGGHQSDSYLFLAEAVKGYLLGHSLVIYQHMRGQQRSPYLKMTLAKLRATTGAPGFALWGGTVAFFVLPQPGVGPALQKAGRLLARRWRHHLSYKRF